MALVLFDLNGTLLDPGAHSGGIQAGVRLAMVHTLAGEFRPLAELVEAAGGEVPDVMAPFPDVQAGLDRLAAAGHRLAVLTNSARATGERHLTRANLRERFEAVIGADDAGTYKPDRRAYACALERLGADATGSWLVAAHDWDVIGAHASGLRTAFVDLGRPHPVTMSPDAWVAGLDELELDGP
jgi:2-haloalkanoic acid dehalogenase type II